MICLKTNVPCEENAKPCDCIVCKAWQLQNFDSIVKSEYQEGVEDGQVRFTEMLGAISTNTEAISKGADAISANTASIKGLVTTNDLLIERINRLEEKVEHFNILDNWEGVHSEGDAVKRIVDIVGTNSNSIATNGRSVISLTESISILRERIGRLEGRVFPSDLDDTEDPPKVVSLKATIFQLESEVGALLADLEFERTFSANRLQEIGGLRKKLLKIKKGE